MKKIESLYGISSKLYDLIGTKISLEIEGKKDSKEYEKCLKAISETAVKEDEEAKIIAVDGDVAEKCADFTSENIDNVLVHISPFSSDFSIGAAVGSKLSKRDAVLIRIKNILYGSDILLDSQTSDLSKLLYEHFVYNKVNSEVVISILEQYISSETDEDIKKELIDRIKTLSFLAHSIQNPTMSISEEAKYACDFERMMNIGAPFSTLIASNNDKSNATVLKSYIRASIAQLDEELRERVKKTIHDTNEYSITVLDGRGLSKEQLDELFKYVHEDERIYSKKQAILERKA